MYGLLHRQQPGLGVPGITGGTRQPGTDCNRMVVSSLAAARCLSDTQTTLINLRERLEQGFEVAVVKDATAAAQVEEGDGYAAALVNFRFIANTVWTTNEAKQAIEGKQ